MKSRNLTFTKREVRWLTTIAVALGIYGIVVTGVLVWVLCHH